jgi:hypothetical protein
MENKPEQLSPEENLRADSEIKSLHFELNYGMHQSFISDNIPPELVSQWLDNVTRFEEQYANAEQVTIHQLIGKPPIRTAESLEKNELEPEIKRLKDLLEAHYVMTDRPQHLHPLDYYHFLSEEFMQHLMTNCSAPGMIHFFPYDEFHRDGPEFIEEHAGDFIQDLMDLTRPFEGIWLSEHLRDDRNEITKAGALERIQGFRASWRKIELGEFTPVNLNVKPTGTYFIFHAKWYGIPISNDKEQEHHEGLGIIQMAFEEGDWMVQGVKMPGFKF